MFYEQFIKLCNLNNTNPSAVAEAIGLNKSSATAWKNRNSKPKPTTIAKLAEYFGVDVDYFDEKETAPPEEDGDVMKIREMLKDRPDARLLFSAAEDAPTSAILEAAALIMRYKEESQNK